ncbi:MAG: hypothetical protein ACAH95_11530 [Fimbriimonas sp.]
MSESHKEVIRGFRSLAAKSREQANRLLEGEPSSVERACAAILHKNADSAEQLAQQVMLLELAELTHQRVSPSTKGNALLH